MRAELADRLRARIDLLAFTRRTFPGYQVNWHHVKIAQALRDVAERKNNKLMIFTPPRHGKTELVSRRFPAWLLGREPDMQIIAASYAADLARSINRDAQRIIDTEAYRLLFPGTTLNSDNVRADAQGTYLRNSDEFEIVGRRGYYKGAGVCGGITGRGFNIGIIDDPIKDRLTANSPTFRERLWEWYNDTFLTRRANEAACIVLVQTRWHEDDLAGRLLEKEPGEWRVLCLPALAETDHPLHYAQDTRGDGEALWPGLFSAQALSKVKVELGPYGWAALYQQRPSPRTGGMFKIGKVRVIEETPARQVVGRVRYWDKAGTAGGGCFTAGVLIAAIDEPNGLRSVVVEDVIRGQWDAGEREGLIRLTAEVDGVGVQVWVEQEPGSGGKESAENTIKRLVGYRCKADKVTGDKATRAEPFAAQVEAGNVAVLNRQWTRDFLTELGTFPAGKYRDQVDAAAGAFNKVVGRRISPHVGTEAEEAELARIERELARRGVRG